MRCIVGVMACLSSISAFGQDGILWAPQNVEWRGVGCQFATTPDRAQDAWAMASGADLSLIFGNLGKVFRQTRRDGVEKSSCWAAVPAEIPDGYFVSAITQTVLYGMIKPVGAKVTITAETDFAVTNRGRPRLRDRENPSGVVTSLVFGKDEDVMISLADMTNNVNPRYRRAPQGRRFDADQGPQSMRARFCRGDRDRTGWLLSRFTIVVNQGAAESPVTVSIDGADTRAGVEMVAELAPCRNGRR